MLTPATILSKPRIPVFIFYASLIAMFIIMIISGYDVGTNADEINTNTYAKQNIAYYLSNGTDTSFMHMKPWDGSDCADNYRYYGSGFDYVNFIVYGIMGKWHTYYTKTGYEYHIRHVLVQLFALAGLLFSGLIARRIKNYWAALITIWLLFLTPMFNGHALMNYRDIPFLTGFVAALYFILLWLDKLPSINIPATIGIIVSIFFASSIRIGGIILYPVLAWGMLLYYYKTPAEQRKGFFTKKLILACTSIILISLGLTIISWPFALSDLGHISEALSTFNAFKYAVRLNFDGEHMLSTQLPWYYLPKSFATTIPVFLLIIIAATTAFYFNRSKECGGYKWLFIFGSTVFPLAYIIIKNTTLYNGWRHVLFLYPGIIICTAIVYTYWIEQIKNKILKAALIVLPAVGLLHPIIFCIENSPYQYTYGNELIGGFEGIYYEYEGEYQQLSITENIKWLFEHEPILSSKDTIVIACNQFSEAAFIIKDKYPQAKVKVVKSTVKYASGVYWQYAVFSSLFLEPDYLRSNYPPDYTIHTKDIASLPIGVVLKNFERIDYMGYVAFGNKEFRKADSLLNLHLQNVHYTEHPYRQYAIIPGMIAASKFMQNDFSQAYAIAQTEMMINPEDKIAQQVIAEINRLRRK